MLEFKSLSAGYHGKEILHDINLKLQPGKLTVLIGPNGCGKSTLLRSGAALLRPISGEVLLNNVPLKTMSRRKIAQSLALLPQEKSIPPITAQRLVLHGRFPNLSYPRTYSKEDQQIAADALAAVGASALADKPLQELSGGQQQSIYLAMVLAQQTDIILMDEPTSWLDIAHQFQLMETVHQLTANGKTILMVLHDLPLAFRFADAIAVMENG